MTYDLGIIKRQRFIPTGNTATVTGAITTSFTQDSINYTAHIFTGSGSLLLSTGVIAEYFIVGGGGAGGGAGTDGAAGGGGGGGVTTGTIGLVGNTNYTITVGAGGGGRLDSTGTLAGSSSISGSGISIIALGGGFGSANGVFAGAGGSGGGAHQGQPTPGAANSGTFSTGGGPNTANRYVNTGGGSTAASLYGAGGGGGAGAVGVTGTTTFGGSGGTGTFTTIISTTVGISLGIGQYITATNALYFAGGGGGSSYVATMGSGGLGGGAPAGVLNSTGTRYTGGGGGGAYAVSGGSPTGYGGSGGSGVVIVRYPSFADNTVISPTSSQGLALQADSNFNKNSLVLSNLSPSVSTYTTSGTFGSSITVDYLVVGGGGGGGGTTSTITNPGGGGGGAGGVLSTSSFILPGYNPSLFYADPAYVTTATFATSGTGGWVSPGTDFTGTNYIWQYDNRGNGVAATKTKPLNESTLLYFEIYCGASVTGPWSGQAGNRALLVGLLRNSQTVSAGWTGMFLFNGYVQVNDVQVAQTPLAAYTSGDILNIAYDPINNKQWFGRNGTWQTGYVPGVNPGWDISGTGSLVLGFSNESSNSASMQGIFRTSSQNTYAAPTGFIPYNSAYVLTSSTWTITVGAGGAGGTSSVSPTSGANGQNSSISFSNTNIIAYGGGAGGASLPTVASGASGGSGGGGSFNTGGGVTVTGQGNVGAPTAAQLSAAAQSLSFNGTTQSLSLANNARFAFGSGAFTVECWFYQTDYAAAATGNSLVFLWKAATGRAFNIFVGSTGVLNVGWNTSGSMSGGTTNLNTWYHMAFVGDGANFYLYLDGVQVATAAAATIVASTDPLFIGGNNDAASPTWLFRGYISNVRIVKGQAVYTGNFTRPTGLLSVTQTANPYGGSNTAAISTASNTSLLLISSSIIDSSSYGATITNNGSVTTVSSAPPINQFTYPAGGGGGAGTAGSWSFQSATGGDGGRGTYTSIVTATTAISLGIGQYIGGNLYVGGGGAGSGIYTGGAGGGGGGGKGSVNFNGSSQYLSVANNALFDFGTGDFTVEFWIYCATAWTSMSNPGVVGKKSGDAGNGWQIYRNNTTNTSVMNIRIIGFNDYPATSAPATGVWEHWAVVRSSGTLTWYRNGTAAGSYSGVTGNISDTAPLYIGYTQTWGGYFGSGYLSNIRIVKGLAVYTGTFTPPTKQLQLTQIANPYGGSNTAAISTTSYTSLLLNAQSPTFFLTDSSFNNLSISNAGGTAATYNGFSPNLSIDGIQYTGGGGAGASTATVAGSGGSGMVVIRYPSTIPDSTYTAGAATYINAGGYKTYIFTATGTLSFANSLTYSTSTYSLTLTTSTLNNTSFVDTSYNYTPITVVGTPAQGSFSPFGQNWSTYFNGTGDYLTIPYKSSYDLPSSTPLCFEAWVYTTSTNLFVMACRNWTFGGTGATWSFSLSGGNNAQWGFSGTGVATYILAQSAINGTLGQWNHYAFTRDVSNVCRIFVNGVLGTSRTDSSGMTSASGSIFMGAPSNTANYSNGYMSNVRLVVGSAVYTSEFTPSTAPLTSVTNTVLLTAATNRFIDKVSTSTATTFGTPSISVFSPLTPTGVYDKTYNGSSAYFNGTTDYLAVGTNTNLTLTGDFTLEAWVYPTTLSGVRSIFTIGSETTSRMLFFINATDGVVRWDVLSVYSGATTVAVKINAWNHIVYSRIGTAVYIFLNGVLSSTTNNVTGTLGNTNQYTVGSNGARTSEFFSGYISNLRLVRGTALYSTTTSFTPPLAPLLPINTSTSTSLLLNFNNSAIIDYSRTADLLTTSSSILSTLQTKFNNYSMKFNGTSDYISAPTYGIASDTYSWNNSNCTIEAWIYPTAYPSPIISKSILSSASTNDWELLLNASGNAIFRYVGNSAGVTLTSASTVPLNAWSHVAFTYSTSTRLNLFINGVVGATIYSVTTPVQNTANVPVNVGATRNGSLGVSANYFTGYIDDVRFTRAVRYSTSTVSTSTVTIPANKLQLR